MKLSHSITIAILGVLNWYPAFAQEKVVLACEISNTAGLEGKRGQWNTVTVEPGTFYAGSRRHFFLALKSNIITEESADF
jgi:hypothetical protein